MVQGKSIWHTNVCCNDAFQVISSEVCSLNGWVVRIPVGPIYAPKRIVTTSHHTAVRIYNGLPNKLKIISNNSYKFKVSLKEYLHLNSYYTLDEFFKR
jgi:hypothetical protein